MEKKNIYFFAAIALALLVGVAVFYVKKFSENDTPPKIHQEDKQNEEKTAVSNRSTEQKPDKNGALVEYKDGKFTPSSLTLRNDRESGCFIYVVNKSSLPLLIRLSPHEKALQGNWGTRYEEIVPGDTLTLDPRFRIPKIAFHNYKNPSEEFSVVLGEGCGLD